jgi:hypothetical protein
MIRLTQQPVRSVKFLLLARSGSKVLLGCAFDPIMQPYRTQ